MFITHDAGHREDEIVMNSVVFNPHQKCLISCRLPKSPVSGYLAMFFSPCSLMWLPISRPTDLKCHFPWGPHSGSLPACFRSPEKGHVERASCLGGGHNSNISGVPPFSSEICVLGYDLTVGVPTSSKFLCQNSTPPSDPHVNGVRWGGGALGGD